jgi:hypothetical protein
VADSGGDTASGTSPTAAEEPTSPSSFTPPPVEPTQAPHTGGASAAAGAGHAPGGAIVAIGLLAAMLAAALQLGRVQSVALAFGRSVSIASALKRPG